MNQNDIKKLLYKEKPTATLFATVKGFEWYQAAISVGNIAFKIPEKEAKTFSKSEPAQLLIRWLQEGMAVPRRDSFSTGHNDKGEFIGFD